MRDLYFYLSEARETNRLRGVKWLGMAAFWTAVGLLYGNQTYFTMRASGMMHEWWRVVLWHVLVWNIWTAMTVGILLAGRRFPIERARWWRGVLAHLPIFAVVSLLNSLIQTALYLYIRPYDVWTETEPFWTLYSDRLIYRFPLDFLIYGSILGFGYAFEYYEKYREREFRAAQLEGQLAQSQLETLKMQLHPHFLFNTLHAISSLVRDQKNKTAVSMIAGLSDLLRHALENSGKQEVPLREELEFLELYLDIQQMRFSDRLKVEMEIEPESLDAAVPNLILQPLVENAIRHGIAPRVGGGLISLTARCDDGLLEIKITDDGPGLATGWSLAECEGIGLANTRARLAQLYGTDHLFDVRNRAEGGTIAHLKLPFRLSLNGHG